VGSRLDKKVAIVTGAAGGIGAALVERFLAEGARVVAADIDVTRARSLAAAQGADDRFRAEKLDVTLEESCRSVVAAVERTWGSIDVLVNNAGVYPAAPIEEISFAEWRRILAINLDGVFLMSQAVVPTMKRQRRGRIISMSSGTVWLGTPRYTHYAAAKAGVIGFTRSLASEVGEFGVTVNAVSPGLTVTDTVRRSVSPELLERRLQERPLKRHQYAADVVGAVLFLASDDAEFITGQTINVDGGVAFH
jgi:NAD(P)-dependent dehydrogenase (short-subunit alcohol dehydrogenase family)